MKKFLALITGLAIGFAAFAQSAEEILARMEKVMEPSSQSEAIAMTMEMKIPILGTMGTRVFTYGDKSKMVIEAAVENLPEVIGFIERHLEEAQCGMKAQMQISLAAEEIFVNIANYAYNPGKGKAIVRVEVSSEPAVIIPFMDNGKPYDPLAKEDPDITLSAEERAIGGLGIFLTKKTMDDVSYEYKNGQNILKLKKNI